MTIPTRPVLDGGTAPASPAARRLVPPRWRDTRLLAGLLLLLVSVAVGARVLSTGQATSPVVAVAADLPAGHVLTAADLTTARVRLDADTTSAYVAAPETSSLVGRVLARGVTRGELLPATAVRPETAQPARLVPLTVRAGRHPDLARGDRVDVFATVSVKPNGVEQCAAVPVVTDAEVAVPVPHVEGSGSDTIVVRVAPGQAGPLVLAGEVGSLDLVRHVPVGDAQGDVGNQPVSGLGPFTTLTGCGVH
jgi:hypothetical protein